MIDTDASPVQEAFPAANPKLVKGWRRARAAFLADLGARGVADPAHVTGLLADLRSASLQVAAEPARQMDDLAPKTMVASLWRDVLVAEAGQTHMLVMIECAIARDMDAPQPLEPELAAFLAERARR